MKTVVKKRLLFALAFALAAFAALACIFAFPAARASAVAAANPTAFYGNEVWNGDFEDTDDNSYLFIASGGTPWPGCYLAVGNATLERSNEQSYFGNYSLKAVVGPSDGWTHDATRFSMRFGDKALNTTTSFTSSKYLVRMYVKGSANTKLTVNIIGVTNTTYVPEIFNESVTLSSSDWQEIWMPIDYVCPEAGTAAVDMDIYSDTADPVYFDGIAVFKMYDVTVTAPDAGYDTSKLTIKDASGADITSEVTIEYTAEDEFTVKGLYSKCTIVYNGVESETMGGAVGFVPYDVRFRLVDKDGLEVRGEYVSLQPVEGSIGFAYDETDASYKAENVMGSYEVEISAPYYYTEYRIVSDSNESNDFTVVMQRKDYDSADASYVDGNLLAGSDFDSADMVMEGLWPGTWMTSGTISDRAAFGGGALAAVAGPTEKSAATTGVSVKYRFGDKAIGWASQGEYLLESGTYRLRGFVRASESAVLTASIAANVGIDVVYAQADAVLEPGWNKIDITLVYERPEGAAANDLILTSDSGSLLYFDAFALFALYDATVILPEGESYENVRAFDLDGEAFSVEINDGVAHGLYGTVTLRFEDKAIVVTPAENTADFDDYAPDFIDPASVVGGFIVGGDFETITQDDFWYAAQSNGKWGIYAASTVEPSNKFAKSGSRSIRFSTHQDWERVAYVITNTVVPDVDFHVEGWLRRDEKPVIAVPELVIAAADASGNPIYPDGSLCEIPLYDNDWHKFSVDFRYSLDTEKSELTLWLGDGDPKVISGVASISQIEFAVRLIADFSGCAADTTDRIRDCGGSAYLDAVTGWATWNASFSVNDAAGNPVTDAVFEKLTDGFGMPVQAIYDAESGKYVVENVRGGLTVKVAGGEGENYAETLLNYNTADLVLAPEYLLTVRLTDEDGNALKGATVRVRVGSESLGIMEEIEDGVYTMTVSGEVKVTVSLDGYRFRTTYDAGPQNATLDITGEKRETGEDDTPGETTKKSGCGGSAFVGGYAAAGGLLLLAVAAALRKKRNGSR